jgi:hypothetical protein
MSGETIEGDLLNNVTILYLYHGEWCMYMPEYENGSGGVYSGGGDYEYNIYDKTRIRIVSHHRIPLLETVLRPSGNFRFLPFPEVTATMEIYHEYCWALCVDLQRQCNERNMPGNAAAARRQEATARNTGQDPVVAAVRRAREDPTPTAAARPWDLLRRGGGLPPLPSARDSVRRSPPNAETIRRVLEWIENVVDDRLRQT